MRAIGKPALIILLFMNYPIWIYCFVQTFSYGHLRTAYFTLPSDKWFNRISNDPGNCADYNLFETAGDEVALTVEATYSCSPLVVFSNTAADSCLFNLLRVAAYDTDGTFLHEINYPVEEEETRFKFLGMGSGLLTAEYLMLPNLTHCRLISSSSDRLNKQTSLPTNCTHLYTFNDQQVCLNSFQRSDCCCLMNSTCSSDCCCGSSCSNRPMDDYRMATEIAITAAIVVAIAILLALIWNTIKRRVPDASRLPTSLHRASMDSIERLVHERLRNRPPPYSSDADKPPTYEDSFNDSPSPPSWASVANGSRERSPSVPFSRSSSENDGSCDNAAYTAVEQLPIPSISRSLEEPRPSLDSQSDQVMLHL